jgi:predicted nucleotidyltransferase
MSTAAHLVPPDLLGSVVRWFDPQRVILFGSRARGDAGPDSDIDLLVVVDDDTPGERLGWRGVYEARRSFHEAVDILPLRRRRFDERRGVVGSLPWTIDKEGVVVFDRG